jgi:hypothetical protein
MRDNSRATITFCWLPPDSVPAPAMMLGVRTSNVRTSSSASVVMAA